MSASVPDATSRQAIAGVAKWWWLFIITGILWLVVGFILFQFDTQSVATLGYLVGFMLLFTGIEQFLIASATKGWKWVWILFGIFFVLGGVWAIFNPGKTVFSLASSLGLLFGLIGIFWIVEAFATKRANPLWWLSLVSGLLMIGIGFWVGQQGLLEKAITLLTFAAIWALLHGVGDFVRAWQLKKLGNLVEAG